MQTTFPTIAEQRRLLQLEYEAERQAFSRLTDVIGMTRLVERGNAWWPVRPGRVYYNSLNQRVVELNRPASDDNDSDHNFEYGRPVSLFTLREAVDARPQHHIAGTVSYVDGDRMVVVVPDSADLSNLENNGAGVMLSFDETTYRTMTEALDRLAKAKGRLGELRDLVYSHRRAGELMFAPLRFPYLNDMQQLAVNKVLVAKDVAVVHGPPGTGKTTTLVEAIYETLHRESQVLVCAQSNMAVDWISERLTDRGVSVLRLGNPSRVNDKMLASTYERRFEAHPDYPTLWSIRKAIRELQGHRRGSDQWHQKMDRLRSRATELEIRINTDLFSQSRVVACTLVGSASRLLEGMRFGTVFIDEAAQALEAACWIPARRAQRIVLAGDHCQLPATVKSYEAMRGGLGISLMERLVAMHPEIVTLLTTQYRMCREIMDFPNRWFYGGAIKAASEVEYRGILDFDTPLEWIDTATSATNDSETDDIAFREALAGQNFGRINRDEALLTLAVLQRYLERIGRERVLDERIDIGIISPYRAQVQYLRRLLKNTPWFKPYRHFITINTVDGFQGQERDVIIVSLVRSNDEGQIGFLRDLRRMNVAMTRARMKLILIGDSVTLGSHPFYRKLHAHITTLSASDS
ncbi:MAG: AAA family ATPase [Muribaculaceae bacterium]|nr:AAA family ATPase [Muribaculaceae bacterium]